MAIGASWAPGSWEDAAWADGTWADLGTGSTTVLSPGDATTVLAKYLATLGTPKNEALRAALNTAFGTSNPDLTPLLAKALAEREA